MTDSLQRLKTILAEVSDLRRAANVLSWDQQVNMPPSGAEARSDQLSTLTRLAHERFTSPEVGELLLQLADLPNQQPLSDDGCLIKVITRRYHKQTRIPSDWVAAFARTTSLAQQAWVKAKAENKYSFFQSHLEEVLLLIKEYVGFFAPYEHPYDPLLDNFEPSLTTAEVKAVFDALRPQQVALIQAIAQKPAPPDNFLYQPFEDAKQWDFAVRVLTDIGYRWSSGCMHRSEHPFTIEFGHGDVRITTHINPNAFAPGFFAALHEGGHALYEQGIPRTLYRTLLDEGASMAVHESQSRLWENFVGRSFAFWEYYYADLQRTFAPALDSVRIEDFYKAINKVESSLIRTEADEATYNLHIMLRFDLEVGMLEGKYTVKDLPALWREKMAEYLGVQPLTDSQGVLQDIHWSDGLFGYFPTYALGNVIAAQLWKAANHELPDLSLSIRKGEFAHLLHWLRQKIHLHGAKLEPKQLLQLAIGEPLNAQPYLEYLQEKYSQLYQL